LIGPLDENFDGYGGDDVDYCHRVKAAGLRLAVVEGLVVEHGRPGDRGGYSASFSRVMTALEQSESMKRMDKMFKAKHGLR
jgi:GT2 family glycosyltransferase